MRVKVVFGTLQDGARIFFQNEGGNEYQKIPQQTDLVTRNVAMVKGSVEDDCHFVVNDTEFVFVEKL